MNLQDLKTPPEASSPPPEIISWNQNQFPSLSSNLFTFHLKPNQNNFNIEMIKIQSSVNQSQNQNNWKTCPQVNDWPLYLQLNVLCHITHLSWEKPAIFISQSDLKKDTKNDSVTSQRPAYRRQMASNILRMGGDTFATLGHVLNLTPIAIAAVMIAETEDDENQNTEWNRMNEENFQDIEDDQNEIEDVHWDDRNAIVNDNNTRMHMAESPRDPLQNTNENGISQLVSQDAVTSSNVISSSSSSGIDSNVKEKNDQQIIWKWYQSTVLDQLIIPLMLDDDHHLIQLFTSTREHLNEADCTSTDYFPTSDGQMKCCGHVFQDGEPLYRCRTCALDETVVFCLR